MAKEPICLEAFGNTWLWLCPFGGFCFPSHWMFSLLSRKGLQGWWELFFLGIIPFWLLQPSLCSNLEATDYFGFSQSKYMLEIEV